MTPEERAQAHYGRYMQVGSGPHKQIQFTQGGITFIVKDPFVTPDGQGIGVTITASTTQGPLPVDNPYQFFNPPYQVVDQPPVYDSNGKIVTPPVWKTDVLAAAKVMVYETVTFRAKQLGWSP